MDGSLFLTELNGRSVLKGLAALQDVAQPLELDIAVNMKQSLRDLKSILSPNLIIQAKHALNPSAFELRKDPRSIYWNFIARRAEALHLPVAPWMHCWGNSRMPL